MRQYRSLQTSINRMKTFSGFAWLIAGLTLLLNIVDVVSYGTLFWGTLTNGLIAFAVFATIAIALKASAEALHVLIDLAEDMHALRLRSEARRERPMAPGPQWNFDKPPLEQEAARRTSESKPRHPLE